jgi:hypothetical protein
MNKLEKIARQLNDEFRDVLKDEMQKRYGIEIETYWNFISMQIISTRVDKQDFTPEQMQFMKDFGDGYTAAMLKVRVRAQE